MGLSVLAERFPSVPRIALSATADELTRDEIASRWPGGRAQYMEAFRDATAEAVARGFLLGDDVDEIAALGAHAWPAE